MSDSLIDTIVAYLGAREPGETSFWNELAFMECVLGDISPLRADLEYLLNHVDSPVHREGGLDEETFRDLALALRQRARVANSQPTLRREEAETWQFVAPRLIERKHQSAPGTTITEWIAPSPENIQDAKAYLDRYHPDAVRYWQAVCQHNSKLTAQSYHEKGISGEYFLALLYNALDHVRERSASQAWGVLEVMDVAREIGDQDRLGE
ncbi:hypothetical protein TPR58_02950 [Sphingomonas sp. HF-S3]|uniref:Uncharacterized protein n=1 Tax=Sphingomonas rustica TaxID=3103142 RepID=A0ABV0B6U2_9SPHN